MRHKSSIAFLILSLIATSVAWAKEGSSAKIKTDVGISAGVYINPKGEVVDLSKLWNYADRSFTARKPLSQSVASKLQKMSGGKAAQKPVSKKTAKSVVTKPVKKPVISKAVVKPVKKPVISKTVVKPVIVKPNKSLLVNKPIAQVLTGKGHGSESGGKKPEESKPVSATDELVKNDQSAGDSGHGSGGEHAKTEELKAGDNSDKDQHSQESGSNGVSNDTQQTDQSDDDLGDGSHGNASNHEEEKSGQNSGAGNQESDGETAGNATEHHSENDGNVIVPEDNDQQGHKDDPMSYLALVSDGEVPNQLPPPIYAPIESAGLGSKVPEPETIALIAIGLIGMSVRRRR